MPEKSWPGIVYGWEYVSGHVSMSRMMVVALMRIRRWPGVGVGIGMVSISRAVDGAGFVAEYGGSDGDGWTRTACILYNVFRLSI